MKRSVSLMLASSGLALAIAAHAQTTDPARTLHVANNGVDSTNCGGSARPCRSISQAITNAQNGDRILVGPGSYGDANGDGDFHDPGDEKSGDPVNCGSLICVNKRIAVLSVTGAATTVIDAAGIGIEGHSVVIIIASDVTFGRKARGFTLANAPNTGLVSVGSNVRISGNTASGNTGGFDIRNFGIQGDVWISDNVATNNNGSVGFLVWNTSQRTMFLTNNSAIDNDMVPGFLVIGPGRHVVQNNSASGNSHGFLLDAEGGGDIVVQFNTATNNGAGFDVEGTGGYLIRRNLAVGNRGAGIFFGPDAGETEVHGNNVFGNLGLRIEDFPNCGLINQSGDEIDARNNFWGAASGPGPDPADNAGGDCDRTPNSVTIVRPFAREAFPVSP